MPDTPAANISVADRKRALRKRLRALRRDLEPDIRKSATAAINQLVEDLAGQAPQGVIAAFRAFDGEPDLTASLGELSHSGHTIALPVLFEQADGVRLEFRVWNPHERLETNRFGIAEPRTGSRVPLQEIGLVLMPLVGWDEHGGRLGMGAGYYDRALAGVADQDRPLRAGIAFSEQRVDRLPLDSHDVRLHLVITEDGRFTCRP